MNRCFLGVGYDSDSADSGDENAADRGRGGDSDFSESESEDEFYNRIRRRRESFEKLQRRRLEDAEQEELDLAQKRRRE